MNRFLNEQKDTSYTVQTLVSAYRNATDQAWKKCCDEIEAAFEEGKMTKDMMEAIANVYGSANRLAAEKFISEYFKATKTENPPTLSTPDEVQAMEHALKGRISTKEDPSVWAEKASGILQRSNPPIKIEPQEKQEAPKMITGVDMGDHTSRAVAVTMRQHPDNRVEVVAVQTDEKAIKKWQEEAPNQPPPWLPKAIKQEKPDGEWVAVIKPGTSDMPYASNYANPYPTLKEGEKMMGYLAPCGHMDGDLTLTKESMAECRVCESLWAPREMETRLLVMERDKTLICTHPPLHYDQELMPHISNGQRQRKMSCGVCDVTWYESEDAAAPRQLPPPKQIIATPEAIWKLGMVPPNIRGVSQPEPMPIPNDRPAVWEMVILDMKERDQFGRAKYKTPLQPFNGRISLKDAYEEVLDLAVYLKQRLIEEDFYRAQILDLTAERNRLAIEKKKLEQEITDLKRNKGA